MGLLYMFMWKTRLVPAFLTRVAMLLLFVT